MSLLQRSVESISRRLSRRNFLRQSVLVGTALAVAPTRFVLEPRSAYAVTTRGFCDRQCSAYSPGNCGCGDLCCQGWTEFCCATHPETGNSCPPGTIPAGWWRADGSGLCDVDGAPGPRYYVDCNAVCEDGCTDLSGSICGPSCHEFGCGCAQDDCSYRKQACTRFRYGQCNSDVAYVGAVVCRYVSCTPPWETYADCNASPVLWSNATASHDRACLHEEGQGGAYEGIIRLWGDDRYATAAAVSQGHYPDGVDTVFVATGENFPDALAGGSLAGAMDHPVLLVRRDDAPAVTLAELERLDPDEIVVLGGEVVISAACASTLAGIAPVTRVSGADRFSTAVEISRMGFPGHADRVIVASGEIFPDALAGGPMAVRLGAPLLLTAKEHLPDPTAAELRRLRPAEIIAIGGDLVISDEVVAGLEAFAPVTRLAGGDRYQSSAFVSQLGFPGGASRAYVAAGTDFPDALPGGAVAASAQAPLLLVKRYEVPSSVSEEVQRLGVDEIVILGGNAVISSGTAQVLSGLIS